MENENYGSAGRAIRKSLDRQKKLHKQRTSQTGVRYNTLRAGESLIVKLAEAQVKKPANSKRKK